MNEEASHKSHAMRWTAGVLTALLLYVLSYGPVWGLIYQGTIPEPVPKWLIDFYQPVRWLRDNTPLKKPLTHYLQWWKDILKKPWPEASRTSGGGGVCGQDETRHGLT